MVGVQSGMVRVLFVAEWHALHGKGLWWLCSRGRIGGSGVCGGFE